VVQAWPPASHAGILSRFGKMVVNGMSGTCLATDPTDLLPADPGLQFDCRARDVTGLDTPVEVAIDLPTCDDPQATLPCFTLRDDPVCDLTASHLALTVERDTPPPAGTVVVIDCR